MVRVIVDSTCVPVAAREARSCALAVVCLGAALRVVGGTDPAMRSGQPCLVPQKSSGSLTVYEHRSTPAMANRPVTLSRMLLCIVCCWYGVFHNQDSNRASAAQGLFDVLRLTSRRREVVYSMLISGRHFRHCVLPSPPLFCPAGHPTTMPTSTTTTAAAMTTTRDHRNSHGEDFYLAVL